MEKMVKWMVFLLSLSWTWLFGFHNLNRTDKSQIFDDGDKNTGQWI